MNYYEWIKSLSLDDMAGVFAGMAIQTLAISANDLNKIIGAETPELPAEDKVDLFNSFKEWLESEAAE